MLSYGYRQEGMVFFVGIFVIMRDIIWEIFMTFTDRRQLFFRERAIPMEKKLIFRRICGKMEKSFFQVNEIWLLPNKKLQSSLGLPS